MRRSIAWLFVVAASAMLGACDESQSLKENLARNDSKAIQKAAETEYAKSNQCPRAGELALPPGLANGVHDPWGKDYEVVCNGSDIKVLSYGPDKKKGTADDIASK